MRLPSGKKNEQASSPLSLMRRITLPSTFATYT